jgi:hypothetical protein
MTRAAISGESVCSTERRSSIARTRGGTVRSANRRTSLCSVIAAPRVHLRNSSGTLRNGARHGHTLAAKPFPLSRSNTMSTIGRRLALGAAIVVAAIGSAAPASANVDAAGADCDARLVKLEAQFYEMADRRGYDAASEWWQARWHAYYQSCVLN